VLFGSIGEKAEVTDTHDAIGQDVEQEAADEFFGIEGHRFQPVFVSLRAKSGLDPIFHFPFSDPIFTFSHSKSIKPSSWRQGPDSIASCHRPFSRSSTAARLR